MQRLSIAFVSCVLSAVACQSGGGGENGYGGSSADEDTGESDTGNQQSEGEGGDGEGGDGDGDGGVKYDLLVPDAPGDDGCHKIDFLFVVDNSQSMSDDQQRLANSFPGFIAAIEETLMVSDYHIMVVDTDRGEWESVDWECQDDLCTCTPDNVCCHSLCNKVNQFQTVDECNGTACDQIAPPTGCDFELGAGKELDKLGDDCGIQGPQRYLVDGQPDLAETFQCLALVGDYGAPEEHPMESMVEAVTSLTQPGECNEGFLRDDAILVVTFITDEEDVVKSPGDPPDWKQVLVDAKGGNEQAVVVLGLLNDGDQPNAICANPNASAPRLREFAESFPFGSWESVCRDDYAPFFLDAVDDIDTVCENFDPPG